MQTKINSYVTPYNKTGYINMHVRIYAADVAFDSHENCFFCSCAGHGSVCWSASSPQIMHTI